MKYRRPEDYLAVPQEELERDIYQTGFFRQKAKAIRGTMTMLLEEFDGEVPRTLEELTRLPGVARKTANVVAAELGHPQGVVVDTHVRRLSQRLGLTRQEDPVKIERDLVRLVPRRDWGRFPHLLIWHGRRVCDARSPALRGLRACRPLPVEPRLTGVRPPDTSTTAGSRTRPLGSDPGTWPFGTWPSAGRLRCRVSYGPKGTRIAAGLVRRGGDGQCLFGSAVPQAALPRG